MILIVIKWLCLLLNIDNIYKKKFINFTEINAAI